MGIFRGQGATEYLVLLAVVLIVALVSVALLGFFPGMAADARITQSQSYWRGQARPFAITEASINAAAGSFTVQNVDATGSFILTALTINNTAVTVTGTPLTFAAGETKVVVVTAGIAPSCSAGVVYDLPVSITYTTPNGITGVKQYGTKNLIGKCTS